MKSQEIINALTNDIPLLKSEIIRRSENTVEDQNYVYVSQDLTVSVADSNAHYFRPALIMFPSGPMTEKQFDQIVQQAIIHESQFL